MSRAALEWSAASGTASRKPSIVAIAAMPSARQWCSRTYKATWSVGQSGQEPHLPERADGSRRSLRSCSIASRSARPRRCRQEAGRTRTWSRRSKDGASTHSGPPSPRRGTSGRPAGTAGRDAAWTRSPRGRPRSGSGRSGRTVRFRRGGRGRRCPAARSLLAHNISLSNGGQPVDRAAHRPHPHLGSIGVMMPSPVLQRRGGIQAQVLAVARADHLHRLRKAIPNAHGKRPRRAVPGR